MSQNVKQSMYLYTNFRQKNCSEMRRWVKITTRWICTKAFALNKHNKTLIRHISSRANALLTKQLWLSSFTCTKHLTFTEQMTRKLTSWKNAVITQCHSTSVTSLNDWQTATWPNWIVTSLTGNCDISYFQSTANCDNMGIFSLFELRFLSNCQISYSRVYVGTAF